MSLRGLQNRLRNVQRSVDQLHRRGVIDTFRWLARDSWAGGRKSEALLYYAAAAELLARKDQP